MEQPIPLEEPLHGTTADLTTTLHPYEALGLAQVMIWLHPTRERQLARFADALRIYRDR